MIELIPLIGGGLFGAIVKLFSMGMEARREERNGVIEALKAQSGVIDQMNNQVNTNKGFAITRRIIALSITAVVVLISLNATDGGVYVMEEIRTGGKYLFGLIDTTNVEQVWTKLEGAVLLPVVSQSFQAIVGAYFGASIAGNK